MHQDDTRVQNLAVTFMAGVIIQIANLINSIARTFQLVLKYITFEKRNDLPDLDGTVAGELTHGHFQKVERFTDKQ